MKFLQSFKANIENKLPDTPDDDHAIFRDGKQVYLAFDRIDISLVTGKINIYWKERQVYESQTNGADIRFGDTITLTGIEGKMEVAIK